MEVRFRNRLCHNARYTAPCYTKSDRSYSACRVSHLPQLSASAHLSRDDILPLKSHLKEQKLGYPATRVSQSILRLLLMFRAVTLTLWHLDFSSGRRESATPLAKSVSQTVSQSVYLAFAASSHNFGLLALRSQPRKVEVGYPASGVSQSISQPKLSGT